MPNNSELTLLLSKMLDAYRERNWEQFHSPKNLVMNLSAEIAELVQLFRWQTEEQSYHLDTKTFENVRDEIGDIFNALVYLSHKLGIDPIDAGLKKLTKLHKKYPVVESCDNSSKYTHYLEESQEI